MKKCLSFILSVIMSISAIASCWNVSAGDLNSTEEMFYESTTSEIEATNSFGKLLVDAIDENEEEFEGNGCYIINDLSFELSTGAISVNLNNVDYCNILVGFYSDDGTELITSVSQELLPESDEAELYIDTSILPENFLIKAYLLDYNQLPMSDAYTCNTYTKAMQDILAATIYDFDQDYVVNLDNDTDTNFFVLKSETAMINSTDSENILLDADFENGTYTYLNPSHELSALNEGDIFYNQCGDSIVIDKVGNINADDGTITITSSGTDFQEVFDFIKIESDSSDLDILEMDESVEENAELISYEKKNSNNAEKNVRLFNSTLKKGDASFWDSFEFKFKLGEDKLYEKKSDDNEELKESEGVTASGDVTFNLDPHINFYWNGSYFEANIEVVTKVIFNASLTGSYTGQICKFREIALGGNGIYFKVSPVLEVSASASINVDAVSIETFGLHYDTKNKFKILQKAPEVTTNGLNCTGTIKLYVNFQPKIVLITDKAANIKLDAKAGVKVTMKSNSIFSDFFGNNTEIHECDSCISGKVCFFGELSVTGSALDGKFSLKKDILSITIPITDYYISSTFNEFGLTECPHYKCKLEFKVRDEHQKPASKATITLIKQQPKILQLVGITEPKVDKITTNSEGTAEIWYPKSYSSNIPITINVSYNDYEPKEFEYQFTGKARKFNVNIYPVGYIEEKIADFVELLKGIDTSPVTTTSTTEPSTITTTTTTDVSENIIASGECGADGDNLIWTLDSEGTLIISGEGKMKDYTFSTWIKYNDKINKIIINNGITSIGYGAFSNVDRSPAIFIYAFLQNLESIYIPKSILTINQYAFWICSEFDAYYEGSQEQWNIIKIDANNEYLINATIHYNSSTPTAQTLSLSRNKNASAPHSVKTYTYSNAVPDTEYLLMIVNDIETQNILSTYNLLYIDQQTADESGGVTFNYIAPDDCTYIFIGDFGKGEYCRVVSNAIITDTEQCTICKSSSDDDFPDNGDVTTTTSSITTATTTTSSTTTTMTTTTTTTVSGICGDVNCDGKVNIADAVALEKYISGSSDNITEEGIKNADVNLDGVINDKDVHYLKLSIMNFITLPYIVEDPDNGILYGDVTCDGIVNVCDVIILNKYLSNSDYYLSTQSLLNADVDCDGEVTREDSTYILKSIVHLVMIPINKSN